MSALFGAGWSGMGMIQDLDRGVLDRFLVSPASRVAIIAGRLAQVAVVTVVQSLIIVGLGLVVGARFDGGFPGVLGLIGCAILLAMPFAALSNGMALLARKEESVIGAVQFVQMPLTFMSSVFMATALMPVWMQVVARFNPVEWAMGAARTGLGAQPDWSVALAQVGCLALFTVLCGWVAVRAFRSYQRSI
jgi:ABC-2 type transport system permease protein